MAVGSSIWQCQALEGSLVDCILIGNKLQRDSPPEIVEAMYLKFQKMTLGSLTKEVSALTDIPEGMKERLRKLTIERNWLAHRSWADILPHANSQSTEILYKFLDRINNAADEALALHKEFEKIVEQRVINSGVTKEFIDKTTEEIYSRWLAG